MKWLKRHLLLQNVLTIGVFLVLLAPFIDVEPLFLPAFFAHNMYVRFLGLLIFPFAIAAGWGQWRALLRRPVVVSVLIATGVVLLATLFSEDPYRSFFGEMIRSEGFVQFATWVLFFFSAVWVFQKKERYIRFAQFSILIALVIGSFAVYEEVLVWLISDASFNYRIYGRLANPLFFGASMALNGFLAIMVATQKHGKGRVLYVIAGILLFLIALASGSRSIVLGYLVAGIPLAIHLSRKYIVISKRRLRNGAIGGILLVVVVGLVVAGTQVSPFFERLSGVSLKDVSLTNRIDIWKHDIPYILERPLFGWGPENHTIVFYRSFDASVYSRAQHVFDRAHNITFEALVTTGIIGFLAQSAMVIVLLWTIFVLYRRQHDQRLLWIFAASAVFFSLAFDQFLFETLFSLLILIPLAAFVVAQDFVDKRSEKRTLSRPRNFAKYITTSLVSVVGVGTAIYLVVIPVYAAQLAAKSFQRYAYDLQGAIDGFGRVFRLQTFTDPVSAKRYSSFVSKEIVRRQVRDQELILEAGAAAETALLQMMRRHPWDPTLGIHLASLYEQMRKLDASYTDKAEPVLKEIIRMYPERFEASKLLTVVYMNSERTEEALTIHERMISLNPNLPSLYLLYAITLYHADRIDDAYAVLDRAVELDAALQYKVDNIRTSIEAGEVFDAGLSEFPVDADGESVVETGDVSP